MSMIEASARFAPSGIDWWIAGGYAIDLFLAWESRPHADLDVEMFRSDSSHLFDLFNGWDLHVVSEGGSRPWSDPMDLDVSVFGVWIRQDPASPWQIEILLADGDRDEWRFRRDSSITISGRDLIKTTANGIPYGTPEVQLLYKALQTRAKDDVDLARCLHRMDKGQRSWLGDAVARLDNEHPWVEVLAASLSQGHE
jgi:hypothetical protein